MPELDSLLRDLPADLGARIRRGVPLRDLTTLRIGGPAGCVCPLRTPEDALRFQALGREKGIPVYVLGAGSNVLAGDGGYPGLVLHVETDRFETKGEILTAGAGLGFDDLIERSLRAGLTGLEFASGIPGTLGGALVGNAGCYGREIGEFLLDALVLKKDGRLQTVGPEEFRFRYRATDLRETGDILLEARLRLDRGDSALALACRGDRIADRRAKHPVDQASAGSWFRNLEPAEPGGMRQAAGKLLEEVGAKQMSQGAARVFARHANIIVNDGGATAEDVSALAARMRQAVRDRFGVELVEEVRRLGAFS